MKLDVTTIRGERGRTMDYTVSEQWAVDQFQGMTLRQPLTLMVQLMNEGGGRLRLTGRAIVRLDGPCARCTEPVHQERTVLLEADFRPTEASQPRPSTRREEVWDWQAAVEQAEEDSTYPYSGSTIDLDPMLREQILPALPLRLLCSPDCAGLCPHCGANRNQQSCTCEVEAPSAASPFAGLKQLFQD